MVSPTYLKNLAITHPTTPQGKSQWTVDAEAALLNASEMIEMMLLAGIQLEQKLVKLQQQIRQLKDYS